MNRECHGDHFTIAGKQYYRCLLDGKIVRMPKSKTCPNCHREIGETAESEAFAHSRPMVKVGPWGWQEWPEELANA